MTTSGPLEGVRILDLTHIASGPFSTMLLADMGADVIKVERPTTGDGSRQMDASIRGGFSGYFLGLNKNKRSVALDMATQEGRETVIALARRADVLVENLRPGAIDRLGLGYEHLKDENPALVYCSITGFGRAGDLRDAVAYDIIGQALGGIMEITGDPDRPPAKCGAPIADLTSGMYAAMGILAALVQRQVTGAGQHVDTSLLGATTSLVSSYLTSHAMGTTFNRLGSAHNTLAPYQAFRGLDGEYFILAAANDKFFALTVDLLGRTDMLADPRYATNPRRTQHRAELEEELQAAFITRPAADWICELEDRGVPVSAIRHIADLGDDPQLRDNGYVVTVDQPGVGPLPMTVAPVAFNGRTGEVRRPAPALDEHRDEILAIARGAAEWGTRQRQGSTQEPGQLDSLSDDRVS
jgi:crotonobetainyl-CoA:carnitine CoA-transferase CaiB-like acyl-CoA transferase